jgi:hypothetical protein
MHRQIIAARNDIAFPPVTNGIRRTPVPDQPLVGRIAAGRTTFTRPAYVNGTCHKNPGLPKPVAAYRKSGEIPNRISTWIGENSLGERRGESRDLTGLDVRRRGC